MLYSSVSMGKKDEFLVVAGAAGKTMLDWQALPCPCHPLHRQPCPSIVPRADCHAFPSRMSPLGGAVLPAGSGPRICVAAHAGEVVKCDVARLLCQVNRGLVRGIIRANSLMRL